MNAILKEITNIIEINCESCPVGDAIQGAHGSYKKYEYCNKICVIGKKIQKLSKELEFGNDVKIALECDEANYLMLKQHGLPDKEIMKRFGISRNTLARRKKHWGIKPGPITGKKLDDKSKREYLALKLQNFSDKQVAKHWGIGNNTLLRWKRENNLKGGLESSYKLDDQGRTKQEYLNLKLQDKTDREIARLWDVGKGTLLDWKRRNNIRGGL